MASHYKASCPCGFESSTRIGGSRETYQTESYFPFYCENCGLINVNIEGEHDICPSCSSKNIKPYGHPETSTLTEWKGNRQYAYYPQPPATENLCPKCKKKTLSFKLTMITD